MATTETFLRLRAVKAATGLGKTSIYALIRAGAFPRPVKLGEQARAWPESEVAEWQRQRMAERSVNCDRDRPPTRGSIGRGTGNDAA